MTADFSINRVLEQALAVLDEAYETVRDSLPAALRTFAAHPDLALYRFAASSQLQASGVRLRSLLGVTSRHDQPGGRPPADVYIELCEADQYRRELVVSQSALRRGRPALELRLNEFSPIPVADAEFDYRVIGAVDGGHAVEVAVVRRTRIDAAIAAVPAGARGWTVGGALDAHGRPEFSFASGKAAATAWSISPAWRVVAALTACVVVCLLWSDRLERDAEMLELRRGELIGFARGLHEADLAIADATTARGADPSMVSLDRVVEGLAALAQREPDRLGIRRVDLDADVGLIVETVAPGNRGAERVSRLEISLEDES